MSDPSNVMPGAQTYEPRHLATTPAVPCTCPHKPRQVKDHRLVCPYRMDAKLRGVIFE